MSKIKVRESELIYYIKEAVKKYTKLKPVIKEGEGRSGVSSGGATSANSSGQYISGFAWQEGGVLTDSGRKDDIGSLPPEVDYTAAKGCPCEAWQIAELGLSSGDIEDPRCCPEGGGTFSYDTPLTTSAPCCEPCPEKRGWWKRCGDSENDNSPCIYPTISDCELVKKEQTIKIKESDIIKMVKKIIKEQK
tara:strand:+ start:2563 stop:3135 length:573 start_codon:yes stop_codon:yes gene_type:complete